MWRVFDYDTRRRTCKVWKEIVPTLANDPRRWNRRQRVRSLPPFVRFWKRAGTQARQVSGSRQTPVPPLMALCSTRHNKSSVCPEIWRGRCGNKDLFDCGANDEPHMPADGSLPNQFFCVRCDQRTATTRKHELWECPGNNLISHSHIQKSDHLVKLAQ